MSLYDRFYFRFLCFYRKAESLLGFQNDERYYYVAIFMTIFSVSLIFVVLLVMKAAGVEDSAIPTLGDIQVLVLSIVNMVFNCLYFLLNKRCRFIESEFSEGGKNYSKSMNMFVDSVVISIIILMFGLSIFLK